ncbi:MAG: hypothetical protein ACXAB7_17020 [Candidatus Kariarchaeaceae archaeon]|jgi:hypothetical protein
MSKHNLEQLRSDLMTHHQNEIAAHLEKDIGFFTKNVSDNYLSVSRGDIHYPTKDEISKNFTSYLQNTTFSEYKDINDPIINFSDDYSVAWVVYQVKVVGIQTIEENKERELDFVCAWITVYHRQNDTWVRLADVSTFK